MSFFGSITKNFFASLFDPSHLYSFYFPCIPASSQIKEGEQTCTLAREGRA